MILTPRQRELHDFLHRFVRKQGQPPTIAEIQRHFKLGSPATIHQHLSALEEAGLIRRHRHVARGIELLEALSADADCEIPLLGVVAAGVPIEAILSRETACVPRDLYRPERFALRVRGDSMRDEGILDGDLIILDQRQTASNGETVVALVDEAEATVKRIYYERGAVRLQPANANYQPLVVKPAARVKVQGVLVGLLRKF